MKKKCKKMVVAFALSASLALTALVPVVPVKAETKTKYVYVVTEINNAISAYGNTDTITYKYKYRKDGRLAQTKSSGGSGSVETYTYNKNGQMTGIQDLWRSFQNQYDKKGRLKETKVYSKATVYGATAKVFTFNKQNMEDVISYKFDKKNRMTSRSIKGSNGELIEASYYTYNNKNQPIKEYYSDKDTKGKVLTGEYEYDSKGSITKQTYDNKDLLISSKNTYNSNNLLTKRVETQSDSAGTMIFDESSVITYKYKKIAVDKAALAMIQAQQRTLINDEQNGSIVNHFYRYQ